MHFAKEEIELKLDRKAMSRITYKTFRPKGGLTWPQTEDRKTLT